MSELLNEVLHTIEKAAKILNVSKGTVRNLISRGNLVPVRISSRVVRSRLLFTVMLEEELILYNPFARVKESPTPESNRKDYIPSEYCLRAMEFAPSLEWKVLIALWRFLGLRRASEPLRLRWSDVDWDNMLIRVYASKTKKSRYVPIFDEN
ncbi:MAG: helix-turn-helix domain-containing protein [Planctomycetaceae bacterium]|nr:helix-turn-helix domain-containing protein [Planctomycetaceae bacterium]